ncbi:MAG: acetylxylan esterase [Candidatus Promineifilaceae bacterium]
MPLGFDMSLEALRTYQGRNPRPADFDTYWDTALAEMEAVDPEVVWVSAEFQPPFAECLHLYFTGVGGARIHAKVVRPRTPSATPSPAVLQFHGYTGSSGNWLQKLPYAAAGMTVAALDVRGQGGRSNDNSNVTGNTLNGHIIRGLNDALDGNPEKLLFRQIFLDTAQLAKIIGAMPQVDANRMGVMGASQGGALTVACAALVPSIKRASPVYPFLSDYKRVWEMDQTKDAYAELKSWFRRFDPRHEQENDVFKQLGYIDIQHLASRIKAEVVWHIGLDDTICPPSSQFATFNKLTCSTTLRIYPDFKHEGLANEPDETFEFMLGL